MTSGVSHVHQTAYHNTKPSMKKKILEFIEKEKLPLKAEAVKNSSGTSINEGRTRLVRITKST